MAMKDIQMKARADGISMLGHWQVRAEEAEQINKDMAMLIKRLCRRLEKPELDSTEVRKSAVEYLERKGLQGSLLRSSE